MSRKQRYIQKNYGVIIKCLEEKIDETKTSQHLYVLWVGLPRYLEQKGKTKKKKKGKKIEGKTCQTPCTKD
jgi:adenylate kinase family enzyme